MQRSKFNALSWKLNVNHLNMFGTVSMHLVIVRTLSMMATAKL